MKMIRFYTILFIFLHLITACNENNPAANQPVVEKMVLNGTPQKVNASVDFSLNKFSIYASKSGKIEYLYADNIVSTNSLLVQYDNYDFFVELNGSKETFHDKLETMLRNFPESLKPVYKKWEAFAESISPRNTLTPFPSFKFREEADYFLRTTLIEEYNALLLQEKQMSSYFQRSTKNGILIKKFVTQGQQVDKGKLLFTFLQPDAILSISGHYEFDQNGIKQLQNELKKAYQLHFIQLFSQTNTTITFRVKFTPSSIQKLANTKISFNLNEYKYKVPKTHVQANGKVRVKEGNSENEVSVLTQNNTSILFSKDSQLVILPPKINY